jgi:hypothetical protein
MVSPVIAKITRRCAAGKVSAMSSSRSRQDNAAADIDHYRQGLLKAGVPCQKFASGTLFNLLAKPHELRLALIWL